MIKEIEITLAPEFHQEDIAIRQAILEKLRLKKATEFDYQILKSSIDARSRKVVYRMQVKVGLGESLDKSIGVYDFNFIAADAPTVLIIGAGPAGLFAGLECIRLGYKPIIIERGKDVKQRRRDLAAINKQGLVNTESNYCFGEGGAGTYSDGKLYTRSNKRGDIQQVLQIFVQHGADEDILIDARPHIGTNKLPHIITAIRESILAAGGEIHFNTKMTDILVQDQEVKGIQVADGREFFAPHLILATGHSAHDIYHLLYNKGISVEAKPFALGVRIEHPQTLVDAAQYHCALRSDYLPPAYYSLVEQVDGRGVFSFCMCPGGIIAPCATDEEEIVVNGWSPSKRNNPFANSGTVVQINLEDVPGEHPLRLLAFQQEIEKRAFKLGGGKLVAPAQRMIDFVQKRVSLDLPKNSYLPGTRSVDLWEVLPDFVAESLAGALPKFGQKMKGYYSNEAILVGVESRTSSPVRIPRDKSSFQHPEIKGLYPCAEGAGYAGGIISAAIDGINCVKAIALNK